MKQNLDAASMWCILPLQDWLGIDAELRHPVAAEERIPAGQREPWMPEQRLSRPEALRAFTAGAACTMSSREGARKSACAVPPRRRSSAGAGF